VTWWGWLLLGLYLLGAVIAWRKFAYVIASSSSWSGGCLEGEDVFMGFFLGAFGMPFWPIIWAGYAVHRRDPDYSLLVAMPRHLRREQERRKMEERIRELERDLKVPTR
jgi:hypothetical protein